MLYELVQVNLEYIVYKKRIPILQNLNLSIQEGEFLVLMGPSGSGKTSILNMIAGFLKPTSGGVYYKGMDLYKMSSDVIANYRNKEIGMVHQFFNLLTDFNAIQNVMMPLLISGVRYSEALEKARAMLEKVGMLARANHYPSELSGGEQQRVAIARALINHPKIILADEPTGNLDRRNTEEIVAMLQDIHKSGKTIVVATHDPFVAEKGQRILELGK